MPSPFARETPPARGRIVNLKCSDVELAAIDALAALLGLRGRSAVLRAGLDALAASLPAPTAAMATVAVNSNPEPTEP